MSDANSTDSEQVGDRPVCRGQVVVWEGRRCVVQGRRAVDGFAMLQTCGHELFLVALDGGADPEWVPQNEIEAAGA